MRYFEPFVAWTNTKVADYRHRNIKFPLSPGAAKQTAYLQPSARWGDLQNTTTRYIKTLSKSRSWSQRHHGQDTRVTLSLVATSQGPLGLEARCSSLMTDQPLWLCTLVAVVGFCFLLRLNTQDDRVLLVSINDA